MATPENTTNQRNVPSSSSQVSGSTPDAGDVLNRSHFGLHLTGRIDSISPVEHKQGKYSKGGDYDFYQQSAMIAVGGNMFEVKAKSPSLPNKPLIDFELDQIARFKVENPYIYNGKVSFEISK